MAKISLEVPDHLHFKIKRMQLDYEDCGQKVNLSDLYIELIRKAIEQNTNPKDLLLIRYSDSDKSKSK